MARKGSPEYKEARKQARRETFNSRSVFPKLVAAQRAHNEYSRRHTVGRRDGPTTSRLGAETNRKFAEYNAAFDAGVERRMGKTAHVPAGHANGGQFTGPRGNPPSGSIKPKSRKPKPETLKALRHTGKDIDPYGPPDPRDLRYAYGTDKLSRALQDYTMDRLKMAADKVQREHPGTKPTSRAKKQALIDYIVKYHNAPSQPAPPKAAPKPRAPRKPKAPSRPLYGGPMPAEQAISEYERELARIPTSAPDYPNAKKRLTALRNKRLRAAGASIPKAAPRPRAPRAKVPSGAAADFRPSGMSAEEWNRAQKIYRKSGRMPTRMNRVQDHYPHAGKRTGRTRAQSTVEYLDARGAHARHKRARGG
jgi:hypothetical protein